MKGTLIILITLIYGTLKSQVSLDFDSINYVTYKSPGLYHISINEDSVRYYSIVTGWEAWINLEEYEGISAKNNVGPGKWKNLESLTQSFIKEPAKSEVIKSDAMRGRIEWYWRDSLVYYIGFYEDETRSKNLKGLHSAIFELIDAPNKVYWEGRELCELNYIQESDSVVIKHFPNKGEMRKPYDPSSTRRYLKVKVLTELPEIDELFQLLNSSESINPLKAKKYLNLYSQEDYYLIEYYKNEKLIGEAGYHNGYYRNSDLCWRKIKCKRLVKG